MKGPIYISDDGKKQGTAQEVADYERALAPLAKLNLPWGKPEADIGLVRDSAGSLRSLAREPWLVEFVNEGLPAIEEMRRYVIQNWGHDWRKRAFGRYEEHAQNVCAILLAYEKALGIQP